MPESMGYYRKKQVSPAYISVSFHESDENSDKRHLTIPYAPLIPLLIILSTVLSLLLTEREF